jgi:hypothetical protein
LQRPPPLTRIFGVPGFGRVSTSTRPHAARAHAEDARRQCPPAAAPITSERPDRARRGRD